MSESSLFQFSPLPIDWISIGPVVVAALTGMLALIVGMWTKSDPHRGVRIVTLSGLAIAIVWVFSVAKEGVNLFGSHYAISPLAVAGQITVLVTALFTAWISDSYMQHKGIRHWEYYPMLTWAAMGGMVLCATTNLLTMFVAIEILSISLYVLVGISRGEVRSEEAALKYFLLGAFSTGFLLFGIAFYYGGSGTLHLSAFKGAWEVAHQENRILLGISVALITVGLGFKSGLVPFHQWSPDVYQGAPTNTVAFLATGAKAGPFIALFNLASFASLGQGVITPALVVLSIITMVVGNIMAFVQTDLKRLMAYSSVANAGYLMVGIAAASAGKISPISVAFFVMTYAVTTLGMFALIALVKSEANQSPTINDLAGMRENHPTLLIGLVILVLSQIGVPVTAGFFSKFLLVKDSILVNYTTLAVVLVLNSLFGVAYYFRLLSAAFGKGENKLRTCESARATVLVCAVLVIASFVFFEPLMRLVGFEIAKV